MSAGVEVHRFSFLVSSLDGMSGQLRPLAAFTH